MSRQSSKKMKKKKVCQDEAASSEPALGIIPRNATIIENSCDLGCRANHGPERFPSLSVRSRTPQSLVPRKGQGLAASLKEVKDGNID
jgi:hypothetical protein